MPLDPFFAARFPLRVEGFDPLAQLVERDLARVLSLAIELSKGLDEIQRYVVTAEVGLVELGFPVGIGEDRAVVEAEVERQSLLVGHEAPASGDHGVVLCGVSPVGDQDVSQFVSRGLDRVHVDDDPPEVVVEDVLLEPGTRPGSREFEDRSLQARVAALEAQVAELTSRLNAFLPQAPDQQ